MSDSDHSSAAWVVAPSAYAAAREVSFALPARPLSRYLTMRDACRIAVDTWLPEGATGPVPAVLILTPYYRRFAWRRAATRTRSRTLAGSCVISSRGATRW